MGPERRLSDPLEVSRKHASLDGWSGEAVSVHSGRVGNPWGSRLRLESHGKFWAHGNYFNYPHYSIFRALGEFLTGPLKKVIQWSYIKLLC